MDCENQEKDKDGNPTAPGAFNNGGTNNSELYEQASDTMHTYTMHTYCITRGLCRAKPCCTVPGMPQMDLLPGRVDG